MKSTFDEPYTPELVAAVFLLWPHFMSGREQGLMTIKQASTAQSFETKLSLDSLCSMAPKSLRVSNTFYSIDNSDVIILDIEQAMKLVCSKYQISRLTRYHLEQQTLEQIAARDGISFQAVSDCLKRSYERIAEYLETPKIPKKEMEYEYSYVTHTRTYWAGTHLPRLQ